jgi:hypothetical protein
VDGRRDNENPNYVFLVISVPSLLLAITAIYQFFPKSPHPCLDLHPNSRRDPDSKEVELDPSLRVSWNPAYKIRRTTKSCS